MCKLFSTFFAKDLHMSEKSCNFAPANVTTLSRGPQRNQALAVSHGESGAPENFNKPRVYGGFVPCARVVNARNFAPALVLILIVPMQATIVKHKIHGSS